MERRCGECIKCRMKIKLHKRDGLKTSLIPRNQQEGLVIIYCSKHLWLNDDLTEKYLYSVQAANNRIACGEFDGDEK